VGRSAPAIPRSITAILALLDFTGHGRRTGVRTERAERILRDTLPETPMAIIFEGIQSPVLMESEPGFSLFVLTHFLRADRHPLRSKTP